MAKPASVSLVSSATVFVVEDVPRSVQHYCEVLGFHTEFTYGEPTFYAGVERDGVLIHLQAARETKRQPGHGAINVFVTDVDALYRELQLRGARILKEPKDYAYGMRDFDIHDLDGNQLCFGMESQQKE
ncbi:MAG TPA: VOC family protein [Terriglobales bacterium]|jgi:catechol 2,3-dioxygenase-like lactoylglutathione lyase family enzyme|nr:VOC family protein [Terriglobales bacterium]